MYLADSNAYLEWRVACDVLARIADNVCSSMTTSTFVHIRYTEEDTGLLTDAYM